MNQETRKRAVNALLFQTKTFGGKFFPEVYVIGEHIAFFRNQAKRLQDRLNNSSRSEHKLEIVTFSSAFFSYFGKYPTSKMLDQEVDYNVSQEGDLFDGQLYTTLKPNYNGNIFKSVSEPARADSGRRRAAAKSH